MLRLDEAPLLLEIDYLPIESGSGLASDGLWHVAASTYMPKCSSKMIDLWFGWIHTTEQYKLWQPRDHVFSDWEGARDNKSEYVGGHHLVHEYVGGKLLKLKISFKDPAEYFGYDWKAKFEAARYGTAVCGRVGDWNPESGKTTYHGHLIHLTKEEPDACRMRSRFWLGDVEGSPTKVGDEVPEFMKAGLMQHAAEEMAMLASRLSEMYKKHSGKPDRNL